MLGGRQSHDQKSFMVYVESESQENDELGVKPKGYCALYNGQICRKYLNGRGLVFYNISQDNSGGWLNEKIASDIWHEYISTLEEPCKSAAEVSRFQTSHHLDNAQLTKQIITQPFSLI